MRFYYVYVLESIKDSSRYIGFTNNLKERLEAHNKGLNFLTKPHMPYKLIYFEGCTNTNDAKRREHYFKKTGGRRFLAKRLREYYKM
ncbi:MAG: GIY-YIG nuclease family protein [Patescibacteria group bacterium]|nr:GIY-YIG nuclease family protein [Patescibacteria group bacterium]